MIPYHTLNRALIAVAIWAHAGAAPAQQLSGIMPAGAALDGLVHLSSSHGSGTRSIDSTALTSDGSFVFQRRQFPLGFYHISINDTDRVDIILGQEEKEVELLFDGTPLQRHITVRRSDENKRLWEYKLVSKESQAILAAVAAEKQGLRANDTRRLLVLDSVAARATSLREAHLLGIISGYPHSYFAKVVKADRGIDDAQEQSPQAVLKAFDFGDASLMRSAVYDQAVMTYLRNIRASDEVQFVSASDSLLAYAGRDQECRAYMLDHLIELFSTYGPEAPLQHLIDRYVVSEEGMAALDPSLHTKVAEILRVGVGATAPEVDLPSADGPLALRDIVAKNRYTVLFFYSSTCDHCHAEMPTLKEVYSAFHPMGIDVVGIALDPDSTEFQRTIDQMGLPWNSYSEFIGWGSKAAKAFRVKATPWFYVLDPGMRIAAKPVDAVALGVWLQGQVK